MGFLGFGPVVELIGCSRCISLGFLVFSLVVELVACNARITLILDTVHM